MFGPILRHGATAVAASAISVSLIAGMALAGFTPLGGASRDHSPEERSAACFAITDPAELDARIAELQADLDARLDAAVAAGLLTEETAAEISERVTKVLERCREKASDPEPDPDPDPKERSKERGLGEIFRLVAGREIGSFFRACFDPSFADRQDELKAALAKLTAAIDAAVTAGDISAERAVELKARLATLVERCGDRVHDRDGDSDRHRHGDRHRSDRRGDAGDAVMPSVTSPSPSTATPALMEVRSFERFFRPQSTPTTTSPTRSGSFGAFRDGSRDGRSRDRR